VSAYASLLFDLDGTLIDSMPLHELAWAQWHEAHGMPLPGDGFFERTAGRSNAEILADMLPQLSAEAHLEMADQKEALYRAAARESLAWIDGAADFLAAAREAGLQLAVCTASTPENMALAFERLGVNTRVDTVVSPADGLRGKPHPDIFLEAARRLDTPPARCLVFEDAPLGVEAARRAGMPAVALTTTLAAASFASFANLTAVAADFTKLDLNTLLKARPYHA
jgi:beta-phosphoglucomutase